MKILPQILAKWLQKFKLFELDLKFHHTKRKKVVQNLKYISFNTWAVTSNPNFKIC